MNKDAILASGIGFGVGLLITGAILLGPTLISEISTRTKDFSFQFPSKNTNETAQTNEQPQVAGDQTTSLTIETPDSESIVNSDTVTISGKAKSNSFVIVAGDVDEKVTAIESGNSFNETVSLKEGKNEITVTNVIGDQATVQKITIFYTPKS